MTALIFLFLLSSHVNLYYFVSCLFCYYSDWFFLLPFDDLYLLFQGCPLLPTKTRSSEDLMDRKYEIVLLEFFISFSTWSLSHARDNFSFTFAGWYLAAWHILHHARRIQGEFIKRQNRLKDIQGWKSLLHYEVRHKYALRSFCMHRRVLCIFLLSLSFGGFRRGYLCFCSSV